MRSATFTKLAQWCLILAVCTAAECRADSVISTSTPADPPVSMLELEEALFGVDEADGYSIAEESRLWTSNANAALYDNMLALITTLGGDQAMIAELFQPGAIFAGQTDPDSVSTQALVAIQGVSNQSPVPEPATIVLLGGTLLFLCCYAVVRRRPTTQTNGPIQRAD